MIMTTKNEIILEELNLSNESINNEPINSNQNEDISETTSDSFKDNQVESNNDFRSKIYEYFLRLRIIVMQNLMMFLIIIAAALGLGIGFALRSANLTKESKSYFGFPGELFVRALRFITLPLFFFNLITGMSSLQTRAANIKKISFHTFGFYLVSLSCSLVIGFLLVLTIKPGIF